MRLLLMLKCFNLAINRQAISPSALAGVTEYVLFFPLDERLPFVSLSGRFSRTSKPDRVILLRAIRLSQIFEFIPIYITLNHLT